MSERKEAWMRIIVGIVTGIIIKLWGMLVVFIAIINWIIAVFSGKRNKGLAEFCEVWNTQMYIFMKYMLFLTNKRPFPFTPVEKSISKYEK